MKTNKRQMVLSFIPLYFVLIAVTFEAKARQWKDRKNTKLGGPALPQPRQNAKHGHWVCNLFRTRDRRNEERERYRLDWWLTDERRRSDSEHKAALAQRCSKGSNTHPSVWMGRHGRLAAGAPKMWDLRRRRGAYVIHPFILIQELILTSKLHLKFRDFPLRNTTSLPSPTPVLLLLIFRLPTNWNPQRGSQQYPKKKTITLLPEIYWILSAVFCVGSYRGWHFNRNPIDEFCESRWSRK